ncbi:MAG: EscU/YscU/HrcU family type III secretion system export apparatus switch protein [Acidobacteriota bacterium]|nr:EscU/YscU/HrcU family type III secretion system export apparatus switch protein [Acidobacteriota bacterium]
MAEEQLGEKTEKPSARRLKDAHEKGQVARSQDLVAALGLLGVTFALARTGATGFGRMARRMADALSHLGEAARPTIALHDLSNLAVSDLVLLGMVAGPFLLAAAVVALAGNFSQTGWVFAPDRLTPNWSRLSPKQGLARLKPSQSGLDLLKAVMAATIVTTLAWQVVREVLGDAPRIAWLGTGAAAQAGWSHLQHLLTQAGLALVAIAGADYGLQRWRHYSSLKMTKQEQKDEAKSNEGSPELKARVRRVQREMMRKRMLGAVKTATVVITNPTHYAIAIEYRRAQMSAPVVVAKGRDHLAVRIKTIARQAGIPMVENVPLAQALYKGAEVGDEIPGALFGAVAEVLAYLIRIRQLQL